MLNLIKKIKCYFLSLFNKKRYLILEAITEDDGDIICEFYDPLSLTGNLLKIKIDTIFNKNQYINAICPETLLIIGSIWGQRYINEQKYKIKSIDFINKNAILEKKGNIFSLEIKNILNDHLLIDQIIPSELFKLLYSYFEIENTIIYKRLKDISIENNINSTKPFNTLVDKIINIQDYKRSL